MSILGNRVLRKEDPAFLTVGGTYTADLDEPILDGAAHAVFVRSTAAHARVVGIETVDAQTAPGVLGVITAAELGDLAPFPAAISLYPEPMNRTWLATDTVRFVGEPIAVVVAETQAQALDAADLVWADLDPLPVVTQLEESDAETTLLFPGAGTNVAVRFERPQSDDLFEGCDVVIEQRIVNQRLAACPLEVRSAAGAWDGDDLWLWLSIQGVHGVKAKLAAVYGLEPEQVHVVAPDVGGGFGPKINPYPEELLVPWLAQRIGRPVRWIESRSENMVAMGHGRGHVQQVQMGGTREGVIQAFRLNVLADAGAYPTLGAYLPNFTCRMATGVYDIPRVESSARSLVTNTMSTEAYRGAGRPEATAAIERAVDLFAAELGLDPVDVRRRNLIPAEAFPYATPTGTTYDTGDYETALDLALDAAGYQALRHEQQRRRNEGDTRLLGIGMSVYVEITAGPNAGEEYGEVRVRPDGRAVVVTGTSPHGQGHHTSFSMIASEQLGIPMDHIDVVHGHSDLVPRGGGTNGSRSLQLGGSAVHEASRKLVDQARDRAADLLEASADDVVLDRDGGRFHVAGTPAVSVGWPEIAASVGDGGIADDVVFCAQSPTYPFGAHVVVVEVDAETGRVFLERVITCDDAGRLLNPMIVEGQRHGGIAQGTAQALLEEFRYDADGNPVTSNLADYAMISAAELPSFELISLETPTPANPLGAKGIGESGTIGSTPAVQNAVVDALSHLGVRHIDMPTTAERVWRAIDDATRARQEETP